MKYAYISGKTVRVYFGYKTPYASNYRADDAVFKLNNEEIKHTSYTWNSTSWADWCYKDIVLSSGGSSGSSATNLSWYFSDTYSFTSKPSGTVTIPTGAVPSSQYYSSCGAPTSVTISPSVVTPSGTITISWSGASAGTSNSISGYSVYYRITSNGASPTTSTYTGSKSVASTSTSGSTTFTLSGATRGYKIVCGVVTKGSAGSSYYSGMKTSGSIVVNSLPSAPSVSVNILPSTGG